MNAKHSKMDNYGNEDAHAQSGKEYQPKHAKEQEDED